MQNFAWDDEAEVADRAAADDMSVPELKAKLIALNPTLPVGGSKAKLVERLVITEQMKRALDEESDEEGSDEEPSLKDVNKSIKKLRKDVTKTLTATEGKHDFKKLDNPLRCGCLTGEGGWECGRGGARKVALQGIVGSAADNRRNYGRRYRTTTEGSGEAPTLDVPAFLTG